MYHENGSIGNTFSGTTLRRHEKEEAHERLA
jgi:hypothetical protein